MDIPHEILTCILDYVMDVHYPYITTGSRLVCRIWHEIVALLTKKRVDDLQRDERSLMSRVGVLLGDRCERCACMMELSFSRGFFIRLSTEQGNSSVCLYPGSQWPFSERKELLLGVLEEEYTREGPCEGFTYVFKTPEEKDTLYRKMLSRGAQELVIQDPRSKTLERFLDEPRYGFIFAHLDLVRDRAMDTELFTMFCIWDY